LPGRALDLTGFGTDDKIEIDTGGGTWIANFGIGANSASYQLAHLEGPSTTVTTALRFRQFTDTANPPVTINDLGNHVYYFSSTVYALTADVPGFGLDGALAYWTDAGNALNNQANLLPDYNGTNNTTVLANLNANHYPGLVEFVWPVNVVVEEDGAYIDVNANGVHDNDETDLAVFASGGNADLVANNVVIHFNDIPNTPLDLAGFDGNDRIEIDLNAMRSGDDSITRDNQGTVWHGWTEFYEGASGVRVFGSGYSAVYLEGSTLKTGHLTWTSSRTTGGWSNSYLKFTATGPSEGTLAVNVGPLYNHYQQVAYVVGGMGPE